MLCIRKDSEPLPSSRYLADFRSIHPRELFTEEGLLKIDAFLKEFRATGIMAIQEAVSCWINENRGRMSSEAAIWAAPSPVIQSVLSKGEQLKVAREVGLELLPTYLVDKHLDGIGEIPPEQFPLCLRPDGPRSVSPGFKVRLARNAQDLAKSIEQLTRIDQPLLAQPFMNLPNLVVHGSRTVGGKAIGMQAFLVERKFQGVTLTIRPVPMPELLERKCVEFVDRFAMTGCFHFEFLYDARSGRAYFLEINGRLGGTTAKVYACGYDEPLFALESYGVCRCSRPKIQNSVVAGRHALLKYCVHTLTNRVTSLDYPIEPPLRRLLKALHALFTCRDEILSFTDFRGTLAFYRSLVRSG